MFVEESKQPGVVKWYRVYCVAMTLLYLVCLGATVFGIYYFRHEIADPEVYKDWQIAIYVSMMFGICGVLTIAYGVALFIRPAPWAWIYHLVMIAIGLSSPCLLPAAIPLLIFWIRPETRRYFGRA